MKEKTATMESPYVCPGRGELCAAGTLVGTFLKNGLSSGLGTSWTQGVVDLAGLIRNGLRPLCHALLFPLPSLPFFPAIPTRILHCRDR